MTKLFVFIFGSLLLILYSPWWVYEMLDQDMRKCRNANKKS
jgi:hypothetical protein